MVVSYRRFGISYRSHFQGPRLGLLDSWRWDRKVAPKLLYGITTTRCVITQRSAVLIYFAAAAWDHVLYKADRPIEKWQSYRNRVQLNLSIVAVTESAAVSRIICSIEQFHSYFSCESVPSQITAAVWHYEIKILSQCRARLKHIKIHSPIRRRRWLR